MNPLLLSPLLDLGKALIDRVFPDKVAQATQRSEAEMQLLQLTNDAEFKAATLQMSAVLAEAQSPDPWTSRARPSFMYVMYLMILFSLPMGILSAFKPDIATAIALGMQAWLSALPDSLYTLFGVGYLGYTASRSYDKKNGLTK